MDIIRVEPPSSIKIDSPRVNPPPRSLRQAVVETSTQPDDNTGGDGNKVGEERLGARGVTQGPNTEVELSHHENEAPSQTPPCGDGEGPRLPGQLVDAAALNLPCVAHADVGEADHAPAEQRD